MPTPLDDITVYYWGENIKQTPEDWEFRKTTNFISDFYHKMLLGYKPPKTGRICIHLNNHTTSEKPDYNGSICSIDSVIDDDKYLSLSKDDKYKYILDLVHKSCLECAHTFNWDKEVFLDAYSEIYKRNFFFSLDYPLKKSKDRTKEAFVQIVKTEELSILYLTFLLNNSDTKIKLFEKTNHFWYDSIYEMANNSKWIDASTFGVYSKRNGKFGYYSLIDEVIVGKLDFKDTDF